MSSTGREPLTSTETSSTDIAALLLGAEGAEYGAADRGSRDYLAKQITNRLQEAEVNEVRAGRYGVRYSVSMLIEGLNWKTHEVTTGWIIEEEGAAPRLTTAYVNVPGSSRGARCSGVHCRQRALAARNEGDRARAVRFGRGAR